MDAYDIFIGIQLVAATAMVSMIFGTAWQLITGRNY